MMMNILYSNYSYNLIVSQHLQKNLPTTLYKARHSEVSVFMT